MFNTLKYAKMLEEVGFSREQAETSIKILLEIMQEKLATKQDIVDLRLATSKDIADLQLITSKDIADLRLDTQMLSQDMNKKFEIFTQSIQADIRLLESKMTIKMGAMLVTSIAVLTALQKFLFH